MLVGDDMENWMANKMDDVDSLHVEIDNLNDPLVGFCFIRYIDMLHIVDFFCSTNNNVLPPSQSLRLIFFLKSQTK